MKQLTITAIVLTVATDNATYAQNKFHLGISTPHYLNTGRFGKYLDMKNEMQDHSGSDALKFRPSTGFGIFAELEFFEIWSFDIYYQKYANKTNFGKNNIDAFTPSAQGSNGSQYKMSHSIFGVGVSRKTFQIKGYDIWIFSALSAGARKFAWRPEGGDFSNERKTTTRLLIGSTEAPIYFNIGMSPKFNFAKKFIFSPKIGYEMELMKGDGKVFGDGLPELVQAGFAATKPQPDGFGNLRDENLNRFFVELRVGMRLGKD